MKLNYFSEQTCPKQQGGRSTHPCISFGKAGIIAFNKVAVALLELGFGDKVTLAQDEDDPANWYVFKDTEHGFELRNKDFEKSGSLAFNHKNSQTMFCEAFGNDAANTYSFIIGGEHTVIEGSKTKYWGILGRTQ